MTGLEALHSVQFINVKGQCLAVLSTEIAMTTITIEVPDELSEQLNAENGRLTELLEMSLRHPPLPAQVYRYVLDFLASRPSPEEVAAFRPTPEMIERRRTLVGQEHAGEITPGEKTELDDYDRIEHFIVMLKTGNLPYEIDHVVAEKHDGRTRGAAVVEACL